MRIILIILLSFFTTFIYTQNQVGNDIDGEAAGDQSGISISISSDGTRIAIGARNNDGNGSNSGHVRIYEESGGVWTQVGNDIDGEAAEDLSGNSVSLSNDGTRVAIGATSNDDNGTNSGHVRIYEESGGTWTQLGSDIDGEAAGNQSGNSISLSDDGTRIAIGASSNSNDNGIGAGHVRVYEENGGVWTQIGTDIDGEAADDRSGVAVSINEDGTRVAIGAFQNDGNGSNSGHARIYEENGGIWTQVGNDIDGEVTQDFSGISLSLSSNGNRIAIGAPSNDGNGNLSGHVRIYEENGGVWTQVGNDIDGETTLSRFGVSVSISDNGSRIAVGEPNLLASEFGQVKVYEENAGNWVQLGSTILAESMGDGTGNRVAISGDGSRVIMGAFVNDGNGTDAGHARIFESFVLLPVELIQFSGFTQRDKTILNWKTASEIDNMGFEIQRSTTGEDWEVIDFVYGKGNSTSINEYTSEDPNPFSGINYYRLRQIDHNGSFDFSKIISVEYKDDHSNSILVFPNPSYQDITLRVDNTLELPVSVSIIDQLGKTLWEGNTLENTFNGEKQLNFKTDGFYIISVKIGQQVFYEKIIITKE